MCVWSQIHIGSLDDYDDRVQLRYFQKLTSFRCQAFHEGERPYFCQQCDAYEILLSCRRVAQQTRKRLRQITHFHFSSSIISLLVSTPLSS